MTDGCANLGEVQPAEPQVTLRKITEDTLGSILRLSVQDDQTVMVADNATSIAQAHFSEYAWFRAVYAGETPVGFLMLYDNPDKPEYFLWRLMIDAEHQHRGYGRLAVERLIEYVRARPNATELLVSAVPVEGGPLPFYESMGFRQTGAIEDGEVVLSLPLEPRAKRDDA